MLTKGGSAGERRECWRRAGVLANGRRCWRMANGSSKLAVPIRRAETGIRHFIPRHFISSTVELSFVTQFTQHASLPRFRRHQGHLARPCSVLALNFRGFVREEFCIRDYILRNLISLKLKLGIKCRWIK